MKADSKIWLNINIAIILVTVFQINAIYGQSEKMIYLPVKTFQIKFTEQVVEMPDPSARVKPYVIMDHAESVRSALLSIDPEMEITRFRPNFRTSDTLRIADAGRIIRRSNWSTVYRVQLTTTVDFFAIKEKLEALGFVEWVSPPLHIQTLSVPNDLHEVGYQWNIPKVRGIEAWDIIRGNSDIRIQIMDQGISSHTDVNNNVVTLSDYALGYHGLQVAGVVGAETDNSLGIASLAWDTSLLDASYVEQADVVEMVVEYFEASWNQESDLYEDYYSNIINCSFFTTLSNGQTYSSYNFPEIEMAVEDALANGVIIVAAAGNPPENGHADSVPYQLWPAAYDGVIAISASNSSDQFPNTYNYGSFVSLSAPAIDILTLTSNNQYGSVSGTSFAAPLVSATVALMLDVNSSLTPAQAKTILQNTADKVGQYSYTNGWNQYMGYGRLNAYEAVKAALPVSSYGTYGSSQYSVHTLHWKEETLLGTTTITIPAGKALVVSDYVYATGPSYSKVVVHGTLILNEGAYWDATRFEIKSGGKMRLEGSNTLASVDIEVESGGLLDVRSGSTISMGTNQNLLSYGKVILDGTTIQNFISTRWGALTLSGSGTAGSSIVNSTITGSTNGVRLINAYDIHIDSSFLNNHLNNGLYAYGSSSIRITATEMNSNGAHGLLSDFSSMYFDPYSSFGGDDDGIRADGGSWLTFGTTNEEAFATSIGNTNGVHALYYSYVELGGPSYGGGSTIRNNASYNARAQDNSYIEAQYTWWGHSNPPGSMFNADGSSIIDRSNWLTHAAFKMIPTEVQPTESQNSDATRRAMAVQTIRRDMAASGTGIERWVDHTDADIRNAATMIRLATSL